MLNVNTLPNRKDEELMFDEFLSEIPIEKERKKVKNVFKTNVLVPKQAV